MAWHKAVPKSLPEPIKIDPVYGRIYALRLRTQCVNLIEAESRIYMYASANQNTIGSDYGLLHVRRQAIIWTNAGLLLIGPLGTHFSEIWIKIQHFLYKNAYENIACEMVAILSRHQYVNSSPPSAVYMRQRIGSALVQVMACRLFGAKPLPNLVLAYCQLEP